MPRRTNMAALALRRSSGDPNDPTRAFWKFTEPDLPPVSGSPSPYTTAPPINYTGTPGVDYEHSIPMDQPRTAPNREMIEDSGGVFENTPSLTVFPSGPDYAGFEGDEFYSGDFDENRAQSFPPASTNRLEPSILFGGPTVETPTSTPTQSTGTLDNEPSLFSGGTTNPFDEWWRAGMEPTVTGDVSGGSQLNLSGDGGSIWAEMTSPTAQGTAAMNPQESFGAELTAEPYTSFNPVPEPTGVPVEPSPLNQNVGDVEWTTSLEERRFLPGSEPTQSANAGGDISSFGTFGSPLTLGQVFNAPLASLRYGEGYPITYGGRPTDLQPGEGFISPESQTGGHWEDSPGGQTFVEDSPGSTGFQDNSFNAWPRGELISPEPPPGMHIIGHDTVNGQPIYEDAQGNRFVNPGTGTPVGPMTQQQYDQATFGGVRSTGYRDTRGSATFDSHAANLRLMDFMAFGGAPNRYSPDSPSTFYRGHYRLDDFGGFEQVSNVTSGFGPGLDTSGNWWANNAGRTSGVGGRGRGG